MTNIQECLEEYANNLDDSHKNNFLKKIKEPDFLAKAGSALKQIGMFLVLLQMDEEDLGENDRLELNKITKKMIAETKNENREITDMRVFYLENYRDIFDDIEDEAENLAYFDNKIKQVLEQIKHRLSN